MLSICGQLRENASLWSSVPGTGDETNVHLRTLKAIHLQIVHSVFVDCLEVAARTVDWPVAPRLFVSLKLDQRTVNTDEENIKAGQQMNEPTHPGSRFDNVFDNQMIADAGEGRKRPVKAVEACFAHGG